jgi:tetratricopeptide (TPR) repeat protein/transcriptional regulator with XRE-family HTH domain/DNA polymerase III delta prime subunit
MISHLRLQRERRGWSQATLAKVLGTTVATVAKWEESLSIPPPSIQEVLHLLFGTDDEVFEHASEAADAAPHQGLAFLLLPHCPPALSSPHEESNGTGIYDPVLPPPLTGMNRLIGRDSLLEQLKDQLLDHSSLALYGLPGVGKTALALALAHNPEIRTHFGDGVLWAGLGLHPHVPGVLRRWRTLLGVTTTEEETRSRQEDWIQALQVAIGKHSLLLVFDDVWHVEALDALMIGGHKCAYLLTTRFAHIAKYLAAEKAVQVPELEDADGIQLLTRFAPEVLQHEHDTALTLVRAVGGLPLALTLMSKYLGSKASTRQPRRLHAALTHLHDTEKRLRLQVPQAPIERPLTLAAGVEVSIESVVAVSDFLLPPPARKALRSLSILPAKPTLLTRETALAVAGVPVEVLDILCNAGLLERYGSEHYMLHTLIADYAQAQGPEPEACIRLIQYGIGFVEAHLTDASTLESESAMILAALDQAWNVKQFQELIRGCCLFAPFLFRWGWYTLAEQLLQRASIVIAQQEKTHLQSIHPLQNGIAMRFRQDKIHILENLSTLSHLQGNYAQARSYAQEGLALAQQERNQEKIIGLLTALGVVEQELGDYAQAEIHYQNGLAQARQGNAFAIHTSSSEWDCTCVTGDKAFEAVHSLQNGLCPQHPQGALGPYANALKAQISTLLKNLGVLAKKRGNYTQAHTYYQEGLTLARQMDHGDLTCLLLMNIGVVATEQGDYTQAQTYFQEGLALAQQLGHRAHICVLLSNLGVVADAQGDYTQAEAYFHKGLTLARKLGHRERMSLLLLNLGVVANRQGNDIGAEAFLSEGLTLARKLEHRERISLLLLNLGDVAMERGQDEQAQTYFKEGLALAHQLEHRKRISDLLLHLGTLAMKQNDPTQAEKYLQEGITLARELNHPQLICRLLAAWGELYLQQEHIEAAKRAFSEMLALVPAGNQTLIAHAQYGLACVAASQRQFDKARTLAEQSYKIFEALGHRKKSVVRTFLERMSMSKGGA